MAELLPWLAGAWASLQARRHDGRLPHGLLLTGPEGLGKSGLAGLFAHALLCPSPEGQGLPCGRCQSCRLVAQGAHPDFLLVSPEEGGKQIKVDQIRALNDFLSLKSQYGGQRVAVIAPADRMNLNAANSLLKTLEEPPAGVVLLLTASRPGRLPVTIRSRCQQLAVAPPASDVAEQWLRTVEGGAAAVPLLSLAGGAPLAALGLARAGVGEQREALERQLDALAAGRVDPVALAEGWLSAGSAVLVPLLIALVADLLRLAAAGRARLSEPGRLQARLDGLDLVKLFQYLDRLLDARRHLDHPLNEQLLLEELFIGWQQVARPAGAHAGR